MCRNVDVNMLLLLLQMIENTIHVHKFIERLNKTDGLFDMYNDLDSNSLEHLKSIRFGMWLTKLYSAMETCYKTHVELM